MSAAPKPQGSPPAVPKHRRIMAARYTQTGRESSCEPTREETVLDDKNSFALTLRPAALCDAVANVAPKPTGTLLSLKQHGSQECLRRAGKPTPTRYGLVRSRAWRFPAAAVPHGSRMRRGPAGASPPPRRRRLCWQCRTIQEHRLWLPNGWRRAKSNPKGGGLQTAT